MAVQIQILRGTTAENDSFTGAIGALTYDTEAKQLRIHDGTTQGGIKIPSEASADYVVDFQAPTAANNYTWYRKYKSGWVEQGGVSGGSNTVITLPVEMADTNYTLVCSGVYAVRTNTAGAGWSGVSGDRTSTTTITLGQTGGFQTMGWQVSGMAAN